MQNELTIARATEADFAGIWCFFRDILAEGRTYAYPRDLSEPEARVMWFSPDRRVFVARNAEDRIVGSFYIRPNREGPGAHVANAGFLVCPSARGQGLARRMGRLAIDEARAVGYLALQFNFVVSTNGTAVRAWQAIGMRIVGTIPEAYRLPDGSLVDVYVMWMRL